MQCEHHGQNKRLRMCAEHILEGASHAQCERRDNMRHNDALFAYYFWFGKVSECGSYYLVVVVFFSNLTTLSKFKKQTDILLGGFNTEKLLSIFRLLFPPQNFKISVWKWNCNTLYISVTDLLLCGMTLNIVIKNIACRNIWMTMGKTSMKKTHERGKLGSVGVPYVLKLSDKVRTKIQSTCDWRVVVM